MVLQARMGLQVNSSGTSTAFVRNDLILTFKINTNTIFNIHTQYVDLRLSNFKITRQIYSFTVWIKSKQNKK